MNNNCLIIPSTAHHIRNELISPGALQVCTELHQGGYQVFIVGGAVRDLLLKKTPKDFDVATDADPDEILALFRRARIIGRRFRLVHVMSGGETVEVSTFRNANFQTEPTEGAISENGRLLNDNVFGTHEQDAGRRDFTVNALFYQPLTGELWDFYDGLKDIQLKVLRTIGDPASRYREDPVRMLRAVRLAAKLEFTLDSATQAPIKELADLLQHVPMARLFDEMLKLLLSGHAQAGLQQLRLHGLHHGLLPLLDVVLDQAQGERFVALALENTDQRIKDDKRVSPGFLFACLLWHEVRLAWERGLARGFHVIPALYEAMEQIIDSQIEKLAIPRRFKTNMKEIWSMQPRFTQRSGLRPFRLLTHPRFRAGYDFLLLRCASGEADPELADWWTRFQEVSYDERKGMVTKSPPRRRKKNQADAHPSSSNVEPQA